MVADDSFQLDGYLLIHNQKAFLKYLRKNKMTKEQLLISHLQKKDLFTGEPLIYKNEEQYLINDFNSRESFNNYLLSIDKNKARDFCVQYFTKRRERKNLSTSPSQVELKSLIAPSIHIIQKGLKFDYNQLMRDAGYTSRFNYQGKFSFLKLGPLQIIQDTREQRPLNLPIYKIEKLEVGDYTVTPPHYSGVFIERKSLPDLIGTLCPKNFSRFITEIERAQSIDAYMVVVIESKFEDLVRMKELKHIRSEASPDFILHKIREIMEHNFNIQFLFTNGRKEAERIIQKIFKLGESAKKLDLTYAYDGGKL